MTSKEYFVLHPNVDKFFVTEDGSHFKNDNDARLQAGALKKLSKGTGKVTTVTRAEAETAEETKNEPAKEVVLTPLQQAEKLVKDTGFALSTAQGGVEAAKMAMQAAIDAKEALASDTTATGPQKTAASKLVTKTTKAVADAEAVLSDATLDNQNAVEALAALPKE